MGESTHFKGPFSTNKFADIMGRTAQTLRRWAIDESYPRGVRLVRPAPYAPLAWFICWAEFLGEDGNVEVEGGEST